MPIALELSGLEELKQILKEEGSGDGKLFDYAEEGLDEWAWMLLRECNQIIDAEAYFEGVLTKTANVVEKGQKNLVREIVYPALYAPFINYGTKPHGFDSRILHRWVRIKGLRLPNKPDWMDAEEEVAAIAFLVQQKIKRMGTKGIHFIERGMKATETEGFNALKQAIEGGLDAIFR